MSTGAGGLFLFRVESARAVWRSSTPSHAWRIPSLQLGLTQEGPTEESGRGQETWSQGLNPLLSLFLYKACIQNCNEELLFYYHFSIKRGMYCSGMAFNLIEGDLMLQ